jgi:putative aldouronate transport system substrate-binding protein
MKKALSLALALTLIVTMLAACAGNSNTGNDNTSSGSGTTEQSTTKTESSSTGETSSDGHPSGLEPYEIHWYMPNTVQLDQDMVAEAMSEILKEKINATLKLHIIDWGSYDQQISIKMAAGEPMDLIFTSNWSNDYASAVNKNAYVEITDDMLARLGPNILNGVPSSAWEAAKIGGKLYAIINTQVLARTPGIILQNQYVDKYNFDLGQVKSLEDMTPLFEQIRDNEPGVDPIEISPSRPIFTDYISKLGMEMFGEDNPAGIYIDDDSTTVINIYDTEQTRGLLNLLRSWYDSGIIRSDAPIYTDFSADRAAQRNASLINVINPDTVANMASQFNMTADEMTAITFSEPYMSTSAIIATMTAISVTSGDPERCVMLYDLLYDEKDTKLFNMLSYGIEDVHFTLDGDVATQIPNTGYWLVSGWEYGNMFNSYRQSESQPAWYPTGPNINNSAIPSKLLGFSFDPEPVKSQLAQCQAVMDEYKGGLFTGAVDPIVVLPEFLEKLEIAGSQEIMFEAQRQIDEWKASR